MTTPNSSSSASLASTAAGPAESVKERRNSNDVGWDYGYLTNNDLNTVMCKFCNHPCRGGIYRLKQHVAGVKGAVKSCLKSTPEAKEKCLKALEEASKKKKSKQLHLNDLREDVRFSKPSHLNVDLEHMDDVVTFTDSSPQVGSKRSRGSDIGPMDVYTTQDPELGRRLKEKIKQSGVKEVLMKEKKEWVHDVLADWAYENAIPFHALATDSFLKACEAIGDFGKGYQPPTMYELREPLLMRAVARTEKNLSEVQAEWNRTGCSIMTDAWTDRRRRSVMNLCVNCKLGTTFFKSDENSIESHTGAYIFEWVVKCLREIGESKVIQIVTDNHSANMAAKEMMKNERPRIFWTSCAAHTIDLMLAAIGNIEPYRGTIQKARTLTTFIYAQHFTLALMRKKTKDHDIVRPGVTRFATSYLTLNSLLEKKLSLREMFTKSKKWKKSKLSKSSKGKIATATVASETWWHSVRKLVKVYDPLFHFLRIVDCDRKPSMGFVVGMLFDTKKEIIQVLKNDEKKYKPIIDIIEGKSKDRLYTSLHMAAYFLNPYYFYRDDVVKDSYEVRHGFLNCMEVFYPDLKHQDEITNVELEKYYQGKGSFSRKVAVQSRSTFDVNPATWWYLYGGECPMLQGMAIKILNLTSSSSGCERNWSTFEGIQTKKRNRLESTRLKNLVYVKFNAKIRAKKRGGDNRGLASENRNKARAWLVEGVNSDDDEEEVFPGEGLTYRMVEEASGANEVLAPRKSGRLAVGVDTSRPSTSRSLAHEEEEVEVTEEAEEDEELDDEDNSSEDGDDIEESDEDEEDE